MKNGKKEKIPAIELFGEAERKNLLHRSKYQLQYHFAVAKLQDALKYGPISPEKYKEVFNDLGLPELIINYRGIDGLCPLCYGFIYPLDKNGKIKKKKYCSEICKERAKSKRWRKNNPKKKLNSNLKYLEFLKKEGDI